MANNKALVVILESVASSARSKLYQWIVGKSYWHFVGDEVTFHNQLKQFDRVRGRIHLLPINALFSPIRQM